MGLSGLVGFARFGEKLVAIFGQPIQIDVDDFDRPKAATARFVAVPIVSIGGSDEQTLARFAPLLSPIFGRVDFLAPGDEGLQGLGVGLGKGGELRDLDQPLAAQVLALCDLDPAARIEMGRRGRAYFDAEFDTDLLLGRFEQWCREVAQAKAMP